MKKIKIIVFLFVFIFPFFVSAGIVGDFTGKVKAMCGENVSSKRLLFAILKSKSSGDDPCDLAIVMKIVGGCKSKAITCEQLVAVYDKERSKEGTVIGE